MPSATDMLSPLRNERDLSLISGKLSDLADARFDVVAPVSSLSPSKGPFTGIQLDMGEPTVTSTGVTEAVIEARWTRTALRQLCDKLGIPLKFMDQLLGMDHPGGALLASTNVADLSHMANGSALFRFLRTDDGMFLRAMLSDKYRAMDNDIMLRAVMAGLTANDLSLGDAEVTGDVSADRFRLRIHFPSIAVDAREVLGTYRSPYSGRTAAELPLLFAGVEIANSETGHGALSIAERAVFSVCSNGMTRPVEFRRTHVGAQLDEGVIAWSQDTQDAAMQLVTSQVSDAIAAYISTDRLEATKFQMLAAAGTDVESPTAAVEVVTERFGLTQEESRSVFDLFAAGGDQTVMGLGQAVTAAAQRVEDGDRQTELEQNFWSIVGSPRQFVGA